jgi:sulfite reductase alpha subunit-like flavoprotein
MTVVILVGTETGNSLDYGTRASEDLERLGVESEIYLMDEYPLENLLDASTLIFVCSTTGDGEEPGNMKKFMKFLLRADLPGKLLAGIEFAVFGLGDSSYDKFNYVGKRVYRRMQQLGGKDLVGFRGEGDERSSKGIEGGWMVWWAKLAEEMRREYSVGKRVLGELEPLPPRCIL